MTRPSLLTQLWQGGHLILGSQVDYALEYLELGGINEGLRSTQLKSTHPWPDWIIAVFLGGGKWSKGGRK